MRNHFVWHVIFLFIIIVPFSCEPSISDDVRVLQEDVVYLSSEQLVLTGRIISQTNIDASDHGFMISDNEGFTNPITISLGDQDVPGRFVGSFDRLTPDTRYWVVAYALAAGEEIRSEVKTFTSLKPAITDFSPAVAAIGEELTISGSNFTNDTKVFFGDKEAQIVKIVAESIITVIIPSNSGNPLLNITVSSQGVSNTFNIPFEYVAGKWESLTFPLNNEVYTSSLFMQNDNYVFFGLGDHLFDMNLNSKVFLLDKSSDEWTQVTFEGRSLVGGFASWPFFGSGATDRDGRNVNATEFYKLENGAIEKEGDLPFALYKSFAFTFGESLFVFGGKDASGSSNTKSLEYNGVTKSWSILEGQLIIGSSDFISFAYEGKGYYIDSENIILQFDPQNKKWSQVGAYSENIATEGFAQVIGDKAFIGLFSSRRSLIEMDLEDFSIKRKSVFEGAFRASNTASWTEDGNVYVLRSNAFDANSPMNIWKLTPDQF